MKELTIEQKAQRYDVAIERAIAAYKDEDRHLKATLERIFPQLKKSNDEKIRKKLIDLIYKVYANTSYITCVEHEDMLAWLEKQGDSPIKWNKNTEGNKPQVNHSVLMKTTHGIAEGEWQGGYWHQYRWAGIVRDSDVLSWIELSDLE